MSSTLVCVTCGEASRSSCATRDWKDKVKVLGKTRLICADHGGQYPVGDLTDNGNEKEVEIVYLKLLMDVLKSKNKILEENNSLLKEKVSNLEERIKSEYQLVDKKPKQIIRREGKKIDSRPSIFKCEVNEKVNNDIEEAERESKGEVREKAINNIDKIECEDLINKLLNTGVLTGDSTVNGLYDATNPDKESSDNTLP
ncbi:hypothetical protein WA026_022600 [Henosepilachna vigintioctopunctata]|uniref:Uncharacterized protein n=1 Tax=Henosepilachna vigintioctopunctata TaxID=420089 RepID=A0AAW1V2W1_9CUCU